MSVYGGSMPSIELKNIHNYACRGVNLQTISGELLVLLGPNGAGKTTLLHIIAGLTGYQGSVLFDGIPVDRRPSRTRKVGYLFQDPALFPHLSVASNIAFGLKAQGWPKRKIDVRVGKLLDMMRITHIATRFPGRLSGGEKQRVALARALAPSPEILLLDEPLGKVDFQTSKHLRSELKQLQQRLGITTLYVTHKLEEAEEVADRIAIIHEGRLEQIGRPEEVLFYPANEKVSGFIGAPNILKCDSTRGLGQGLVEMICGGLSIVVPDDGNPVRCIALFPQDIIISPIKPPGSEVNLFRSIISDIKASPESIRLKVDAGNNRLTVEMPHHIFKGMGLKIGREVFLKLKLSRIKILSNAHP